MAASRRKVARHHRRLRIGGNLDELHHRMDAFGFVTVKAGKDAEADRYITAARTDELHFGGDGKVEFPTILRRHAADDPRPQTTRTAAALSLLRCLWKRLILFANRENLS